MNKQESTEIRARLTELEERIARLEELARRIAEDLVASSSSGAR